MSLFKIESFHPAVKSVSKSGILPETEAYIFAESWNKARACAARLFGVPQEDVLVSSYPGPAPVDAMVIDAAEAA